MPYTSHAQDPARRTTAIAGVITIHAALGYVLITGLAAEGFKKIQDDFGAIIIPPETKPTPPPPPVDEVIPETTKMPDFVAPTPPIDLGPITPIRPREFDPLVIPTPGVIERPTPDLFEKPTPQPSFAPKRAVPRNAPNRWVLTEDYPSRPLREGAEGVAGFRVVVGSDGRVDACEITSSSGNAQLDEATCKYVTRRARFEPATDGKGQKVVGSYSSTVIWRIPD